MATSPGEAFHPDLTFARSDIEQAVPARFEHVVRCLPDQIALTGNGRRWTYRDLNRQVNAIAHAIRARVRPGVGCVAFLVDQSPEMVMATLGALKAAKTYLALHPRMPATAHAEIVRDAAPDLLLTTAHLRSRARALTPEPSAVLVLEEIAGRWAEDDPPTTAGPGDLSTIFYTSGTTGHPKGVLKSHRAVLHRIWLSTQHDVITPADRQSLLTHCSFSASEADMFGALLQGARLCVFDPASASLSAFRRWLEEERITLLHPPALLFRRFLSALDGQDLFPFVRLVALAGDTVLPADVELWKRFFSKRCALLHRFSTTETSLLTVARIEHDTVLDTDLVPFGRPVADKSLSIVDDTGRPVPEGQAGEVVVKSAYLTEGYWRRPDETAAAFGPDPEDPGRRVYRTGDLGRFLPDGTFMFLGRRDHQVKVRGYRVDMREVESALLKLNEVAEASVVTRDEDHESRLLAFVVPKPGFQLDPAAVRENLRSYLPEWKIPSRVQVLPSLPTTLTGKVDRQDLEVVGGARIAEGTAPSFGSTIEEGLAEIWRSTLRLDTVGLDDRFLDLGGDSISATMALNRIERRYGIRIAPTEYSERGTIRALAARIRSGASTSGAAPVRSGSGPASRPGMAVGSGADVKESTRIESRQPIDTVSDGYLELLNAHQVDYIFINPGTDTAPILESIAKFRAQGRRTPELVLCLHESIAMAAAHGHYMISGRPQVVLVHVDVGTLNLGANLHNAQRARVGVVVCAGRAPYTVGGDVPGGRDRAIHWLQEQFNQAGIVQGYVKWHYELACRENLSLAVPRAFQVASAEPAGPVYLTLPREVLVQATEATAVEPARAPVPTWPAADPGCISQAAEWLLAAERPLVLVGYAGRNPRAVSSLVRLAELLGAPVVETRQRYNFPSAHRLHLGFSSEGQLQRADCILILDHDVPWVPRQERPPVGSRIIQVDIDPLKRDIPVWGFPVDLSIHADSSLAMVALAEEVERRLTSADRDRIETRRQRVGVEHDKQRATWRQRALDRAAERPIAPEWAAHCLSEIVDHDTVIVGEAVTNAPSIWQHVPLDWPGSYFESVGSGLGWGLGAAVGAKLADSSKTVICVVGDGAWVFGSPIAAYQAAAQCQSPFLTVIFDNQAYAATVGAILATAPTGYARRTGHYPACDLPSPPIHSRLAEAMGLWARTVDDPRMLPSILRQALSEVRSGRSALVDILVSSGRPRAEA
jgi:acetolactate synthase-1/2/3 large subunit